LSELFEEIIRDLRVRTDAGRTTLRLEDAGGAFPVVAEDVAPGVAPLRGQSVGDLRTAATFRFLERERRLLIQDDLLTAEPAPPPGLIAEYAARAQMLAPLLRDDRLVGFVSVHEVRDERDWTPGDIAALTEATERIAHELDATAGTSGGAGAG
jgi:maleate isomerase